MATARPIPDQTNDMLLKNMDARSPIKLLVLPSWYPPRGGRFFREHGLALADAGIRVDVVALNAAGLKSIFSPGRQPPGTEDDPAGFCEYVKRHLVLPGHEMAKVRRWTRDLVSFARDRIRATEKPDLIQVHSSMWAGLAAMEIHRTMDIPYVITEHRGRFISGNPHTGNMLLPWQKPLLKEIFEGAVKVVTVSQALEEKIVSLAPASKDRITTIPNMVDTGFFVPADQPPPGPFTFFCLAHLEADKGIDTLVGATKILSERMARPFNVVIGGGGQQGRRLKSMARKLSLENTISFTGPLNREAVRHHLQKSHAFVMPSRFEAFGVVYIEAMACGLPVIATKAGGPADFTGEETGLLVDPGQADVLASAMHELMQRSAAYKPDRIRESVTRRFSKEVVVASYLELYHQILEKTRKHA